MKRLALLLLSAGTFLQLHSETDVLRSAKPERKLTGLEPLAKPGSQKGCVAFVNAQTAVPQGVIESVATNWVKAMHIKIDIINGPSVNFQTVDAAAERLAANLVLFIVDDRELKTSILYAPESKWCLLNVRPIFRDNPNEKIISMRGMQETSRAFGLLCGAMNSAYPESLMSAYRSPQELDFNQESWKLAVDTMTAMRAYMKMRGVEPTTFSNYSRAVQEGWAPPPSNAVQKRIWDKVHAIPTKPIKIEFDPKTDRK